MAGITMDKMQGRDDAAKDQGVLDSAKKTGATPAEKSAMIGAGPDTGGPDKGKTFSEKFQADAVAKTKAAAAEDDEDDAPKTKRASNKPAPGSDYPAKPGPHAPGSANHPAPGVPKNSRIYDKTDPETVVGGRGG